MRGERSASFCKPTREVLDDPSLQELSSSMARALEAIVACKFPSETQREAGLLKKTRANADANATARGRCVCAGGGAQSAR